METVLGRYRNLIVLVGVLFAQVLGLAVQVKRTTDIESSRLIRVWAVGAVSPLEKTLVWFQTSSGNLWHNYLYLRGVRVNAVKLQIEEMRVSRSDWSGREQAPVAALAFKEQFISQTRAAQVIGSTGSEQSRAIYIDKGEKDGIKPDMAVITSDGIVGKVLHVYRSTSLVLLISDQTSGVGAILDKSRLQGILRGMPSVGSEDNETAGARGGTGADQWRRPHFPGGLPTEVSKVSSGNDFLNIRVKEANLGKPKVLIVTGWDGRQAADQTVLGAADVLARTLRLCAEAAGSNRRKRQAGAAPQPGAAPEASRAAETKAMAPPGSRRRRLL
jgi:rod shape-determining protein MreC